MQNQAPRPLAEPDAEDDLRHVLPPRIDVLGSGISACDAETALALVQSFQTRQRGGYICFTNVHATVLGDQEPLFRDITNNSLLSVADGKPVYWAARSRGGAAIGHVPGPDFMLMALTRFPSAGHFFYGSTPEVLDQLVANLGTRIPNLRVSGTLSPPFRTLSVDERTAATRTIRDSGARFVWVGLGAPKQERWMAENWKELSPALLFGVGAAFDFHSGSLRRAPERIRRLGFEWLYRLAQEPRRLWRRYLVTNSLFVYHLLRRRFTPQARAL